MKHFREKLELQAVSLVEEGDATFEREIANFNLAEKANKSPLSHPTRSLAFIKFVLCHSLPTVNQNGACWTYQTLKNSVASVNHQLVDINHMIRDNMSAMPDMDENQRDLIIGHMVSGEIADSPDDQLVPSQPVPIVVTAVLYKRASGVQKIIDDLKAGKPVKVSMECEFEDMGFFYAGKLFSRTDHPELSAAHRGGKKLVAGKPYARVIGGVLKEGGNVNFHGAAILVGDAPADPGADVLEAIASHNDAMMEVGGTASSIAMMATEHAVFGEGDAPLTPLTWDGPAEDISEENIAAGQKRQIEAISNLEKTLTFLLNKMDKVCAKLGLTKASAEENPNEKDRVDDISQPGVKDSPLTEEDRYEDIMVPPSEGAPNNLGDSVKLDPNTDYADPGYGEEGKPSFPLTTAEEIRAAGEHFSHIENTMSYTPVQLSLITERILQAAVKLKLNVPSVLATAKDAVGEAATDQRQEVNEMTEEEKAAAAAALATATATAAAAAALAVEAIAAAEAAAAAEEEAKGKIPPQFEKKKKGGDAEDKKDGGDDEDEEDDGKPDFLKKKKAKAKASDESEEQASMRLRLEELTRNNETLAAQIQKMQESEAARLKGERAGNRKKSFAAKVELDDELSADLENHFNEADDEEYASFEALAEKIYTRALKKAMEAAGAGSMGSDKSQKPAEESGKTETGSTRKPFAPTRAESGESGSTTTNPFLSL